MNTQQLDTILVSIKNLEEEKNLVEEKIKEERQKVFQILEDENIRQYKNEVATVSYIEKKIIKIEDKEKLLENIKDLPKYYDVIPEEIIPEHKEINQQFEKDVKIGILKIEGVEVEIKKSPMIRFNKSLIN